jgi:hypothetical protein
VDEFSTRKEAQAVRSEYQLADPYARYYISTRACKAWLDSQQTPVQTLHKNNKFSLLHKNNK